MVLGEVVVTDVDLPQAAGVLEIQTHFPSSLNRIWVTRVPSELAEISSWESLLLNTRSLKNSAPALSSRLFSLRFSVSRVLFIFKACERYLEPSYPMMLLDRFRLVRT